eukprot:4482067-Alexandrium_andersonii.AAC.1
MCATPEELRIQKIWGQARTGVRSRRRKGSSWQDNPNSFVGMLAEWERKHLDTAIKKGMPVPSVVDLNSNPDKRFLKNR